MGGRRNAVNSRLDRGTVLMSAANACASSPIAFAVSIISTDRALDAHPAAVVASAAITRKRLDRIIASSAI
jgi:hypothetical protein